MDFEANKLQIMLNESIDLSPIIRTELYITTSLSTSAGASLLIYIKTRNIRGQLWKLASGSQDVNPAVVNELG